MFEQLREAIGPAPDAISTEEYKARQMNLLSQLEEHDLLLIPSRPESIRSNDVHFPYRNHSDMLYMCGWEDPESLFMAYFENGSWKTALFVQPKDILKEIWEGRRPGIEGAVKDWPVDEAFAIDRISTVIDEKLERVKRVYLRQGLDSELDATIQDCDQSQAYILYSIILICQTQSCWLINKLLQFFLLSQIALHPSLLLEISYLHQHLHML